MNDNKEEYWNGNKNKAIRYWFYINRGMDWINQFRNLFFCIIALYVALKLNNPMWLIGMVVISIPILGIVGYIQVHHLGKVLDWLNVRFSTHYSLASFKLQEEIRDAVQILANNQKSQPPV